MQWLSMLCCVKRASVTHIENGDEKSGASSRWRRKFWRNGDDWQNVDLYSVCLPGWRLSKGVLDMEFMNRNVWKSRASADTRFLSEDKETVHYRSPSP